MNVSPRRIAAIAMLAALSGPGASAVGAASPGASPAVVPASPEAVAEELRSWLVLPADARVLGSVLNEPAVSVYFVSDLDPDPLRASVARQLLESGWTAPTLPPRGGFFIPSQARPTIYSGPSDRAISLTTRAWRGATLGHVSQHPMPEHSPCAPLEPPRQRSTRLMQIMPRLIVPDGDAPDGSSMGGGTHSWIQGIELEPQLPVPDVLDMLSAQIEEQAWAPDGGGSSTTPSTRSFTKSFDDGLEVVAQLSVLTLEPGRDQISLELIQLSGRKVRDRLRHATRCSACGGRVKVATTVIG